MQLFNQLKAFWSNSPTTRNILKVSIGDAASKVFSVATTLLLIRGLSVSDYAHYITFSGVSVMFSGIVGAGINMALVRYSTNYISLNKERPFNLYFSAILFQIVIYLVLGGLCLLFPVQITTILLGQPSLALPLQSGLFAGLGVLIVQFTRTLFQAEEKFSSYIRTVWLIQIVIFFGLVFLWGLKYLSFLSVAIIIASVQLVISLWILVRYLRGLDYSKLKYFLRNHSGDVNQFLTSSIWLIGYFFFLNLFSRMDILMLMHFKGEKEVAIYGVAFQYYSLALLFLGSIHAVLLPRFSRIDMQDINKQKRFLKAWLQWSIWLIIPLIFFDVFGKGFFLWLNGNVYEEAFPVLVVFTMGIWLSMMFSPLVNILISRGEYRFLFILSVAALCFNLACNLLFIPLIGGIGAAIVVIFTQNIVIQVPILLKGLRLL